jgi:ribosomal protein S18 acetylase RimI-like enzyme
MEIRAFEPPDEDAVVALWERCSLTRPWNNPRKDIRRKLGAGAGQLLVGVMDGAVIATIMVGYEGHRGWINYLAVAPEHRRAGVGRRLMAEAEERQSDLGCPKINLQVRTTNAEAIAFYERLGYSVDDVVSMGKRLEHDG